jgi:hypothetical protein
MADFISAVIYIFHWESLIRQTLRAIPNICVGVPSGFGRFNALVRTHLPNFRYSTPYLISQDTFIPNINQTVQIYLLGNSPSWDTAPLCQLDNLHCYLFALLEVGYTIKLTCTWQNIQIHFVSFPLHTHVKKHPSTTYPNMHCQESRTGGFEEGSTTAFLAHRNSKRVQRSVHVCNQRRTHPSPPSLT